MNRGCLGELGRLAASAFLRLGALLASLLISAFAFIFLRVVGPLIAGMAREVIQALMGMPREGDHIEGQVVAANPMAYAVLSGLAWVAGYGLLVVLMAVAGGHVPSLSLLGLTVAFAIGAGVGLLVHQHQRGIRVD